MVHQAPAVRSVLQEVVLQTEAVRLAEVLVAEVTRPLEAAARAEVSEVAEAVLPHSEAVAAQEAASEAATALAVAEVSEEAEVEASEEVVTLADIQVAVISEDADKKLSNGEDSNLTVFHSQHLIHLLVEKYCLNGFVDNAMTYNKNGLVGKSLT